MFNFREIYKSLKFVPLLEGAVPEIGELDCQKKIIQIK